MEKSSQIDGNGPYRADLFQPHQGLDWSETAPQAPSARPAAAFQPKSEDQTHMETPQTVQDFISRLLAQEADLLMKASEHQEKARELRVEAVSLSQRRGDIKFVIDAFLATNAVAVDRLINLAAQEGLSQPKSHFDIILEAVREKADTVIGLKLRTGFNTVSPYLTDMKRRGLVFHDVPNKLWSAIPSASLSKKNRILAYLANHPPSRLRNIADGVDLTPRTIMNSLHELKKAGNVSHDRQTHLWSLV